MNVVLLSRQELWGPFPVKPDFMMHLLKIVNQKSSVIVVFYHASNTKARLRHRVMFGSQFHPFP